MFPECFETDRLRFERFCRDAIGPRELYELLSRRNATIEHETRFLPWNPVETVDGAAEWLDRVERNWEDLDRADWLVRPKKGERGAGEVAGYAGLECRWDQDLARLAVWLREPFWGRGYAGERADALLEIAFERLGFGVVAIPIHGENEKSFRAVEKYVSRYGGRYEGLLRHHADRYDEPVDHHRFSISREEYEGANRPE